MKVSVIKAADVPASVHYGRGWGKLLLSMEKDDKIEVTQCTAADINSIRVAANYLTNRKKLPMQWRSWSSKTQHTIVITRTV